MLKLFGLILAYTPAGTGTNSVGSSGVGISINPADSEVFSRIVANTQFDVGPSESAFTISLSPTSTFLAFSPSSKK